MIIAGASLNQTPLDWDGNTSRIIEAINSAKSKGVKLLCLPELCVSSYGCQDLFFSNYVTEQSIKQLFQIAEHTENIAVFVGLPLKFENKLYNTTAIIRNKKIEGFYAKQILANDGVHYEKRWFEAWKNGVLKTIDLNGVHYKIGEFIAEIDGYKIGIEICEDAWHDDRRPANNYREKVDIIVNPSASHFAFNKAAFRENLIANSSLKFNCIYLYANLLGNESGRLIYDGDIIIAEKGNLIAKSERISFQDIEIVCCNIAKENTPLPKSKFENNEEFVKASALGLFDYLRKSKSQGFALSLSGGADSSTTVVLVSEMIKRAVNQIGIEEFKNKLFHISSIQDKNVSDELCKSLFSCVYQSTENSSDETRKSARELMLEVNANYYEWDIDELTKSAVKTIENAIGRNLDWKTDDVALQNIQARMRSPLVWLLSNINNTLLLATSNRSEVAVGYATMDGDTSGSISPIAGVSKSFIRNWLKWAEKELGYKSLKYVNVLIPTAELRPFHLNQKDEDDLMPYDVLNKIEQLAIRDRMSKEQIMNILQNEKIPNAEIYVNKFFRLWAANQWKRERYAPSFHIDEYSLDPKSWARFPILTGAY